jgi:iron complex outermembrane receptor protein
LNGRLTKSLDVYLSGRYDKFSDFGDTFNPKIGLKYRPTQDLMFRTTVGTGFKAPALSLLYGTRSDGFITFIDNVTCERDGPGSQNCNPRQYRVISGGNEDLDAITSFSYSAGFVYEPSNLFDFSVDFWAVDQKGLIAGGSAGTLFEATQAETLGIDPSTVGFQMNRDVNGDLDTNNPIIAPLVNLIDQKVAGIDVGMNYRLGLPVGQLLFNESASLRLWEESIPFPGIASRDNVGEELLPQWRNQFSMTYRLLTHDIRLSVVSTDKFKGADRVAYIDSNHRFDLTYNYSGFENTNISLGMINILSEDPPLDPSSPNDPLATSIYSQRGPEVFLRLTKNF